VLQAYNIAVPLIVHALLSSCPWQERFAIHLKKLLKDLHNEKMNNYSYGLKFIVS
jgi:hypothetical protein